MAWSQPWRPPERGLFLAADGADDRGAEMLRPLTQNEADAAGSGMHENRVARFIRKVEKRRSCAVGPFVTIAAATSSDRPSALGRPRRRHNGGGRRRDGQLVQLTGIGAADDFPIQ
jgi:hypothetical protein